MPKFKTRLEFDDLLRLSPEYQSALRRIERVETMSDELETAVQGVKTSEANLETRLNTDKAAAQARLDAVTQQLADEKAKTAADATLIASLEAQRTQAITELGSVQAQIDALDAAPVTPATPAPVTTDPVSTPTDPTPAPVSDPTPAPPAGDGALPPPNAA